MCLDHSSIVPELSALCRFAEVLSRPDLTHLCKCGVLIY